MERKTLEPLQPYNGLRLPHDFECFYILVFTRMVAVNLGVSIVHTVALLLSSFTLGIAQPRPWVLTSHVVRCAINRTDI